MVTQGTGVNGGRGVSIPMPRGADDAPDEPKGAAPNAPAPVPVNHPVLTHEGRCLICGAQVLTPDEVAALPTFAEPISVSEVAIRPVSPNPTATS